MTGKIEITRDEIYQEILAKLAATVAEEENPETLVDLILNEIKNATGAVGAELLLYHREMNILYPREACQTPSPWGLSDTKHTLANKALQDLKTQYVPDIHESGYQPVCPGARALLATPVIVARRVHGVLCIEVPIPGGLGEKDITWIDIIATYFGGILEVVHLREVIFELHRNFIDHISTSMGDKDPTYTGHADRVSAYAIAIARALGLPGKVVDDVGRSGYLHDIGKVGVSSVILTKPGKLTDDEFEKVKKHAVLGRFILKPLGFLPGVLEGIATHHERWDGAGYPKGLKGDEIPIEGRILAVAEAFDSMTSDQPYREALPFDQAVDEIKIESGKQFDPDVVSALCAALKEGPFTGEKPLEN